MCIFTPEPSDEKKSSPLFWLSGAMQLIVAVVLLGGIVVGTIWWEANKVSDCRKVGYSLPYCLEKAMGD